MVEHSQSGMARRMARISARPFFSLRHQLVQPGLGALPNFDGTDMYSPECDLDDFFKIDHSPWIVTGHACSPRFAESFFRVVCGFEAWCKGTTVSLAVRPPAPPDTPCKMDRDRRRW